MTLKTLWTHKMDTSSATDPLLAAAQGEQAKDPRHVDGSIFTGLDPSVQAHPSDAVQCPSIRSRCRSGSTSRPPPFILHSSCCVVCISRVVKFYVTRNRTQHQDNTLQRATQDIELLHSAGGDLITGTGAQKTGPLARHTSINHLTPQSTQAAILPSVA